MLYWMIGICDVLFRVMEFFGTNGIVIGNTYVICTTTKSLTMFVPTPPPGVL